MLLMRFEILELVMSFLHRLVPMKTHTKVSNGSHIPGDGGGGDLHMKGVGIFLVLLRGVIFGFWPHLGCSGENAVICHD